MMFWTGFLTATVLFATALAAYAEFRRPYWRSTAIKSFEMIPVRQGSLRRTNMGP